MASNWEKDWHDFIALITRSRLDSVFVAAMLRETLVALESDGIEKMGLDTTQMNGLIDSLSEFGAVRW